MYGSRPCCLVISSPPLAFGLPEVLHLQEGILVPPNMTSCAISSQCITRNRPELALELSFSITLYWCAILDHTSNPGTPTPVAQWVTPHIQTVLTCTNSCSSTRDFHTSFHFAALMYSQVSSETLKLGCMALDHVALLFRPLPLHLDYQRFSTFKKAS